MSESFWERGGGEEPGDEENHVDDRRVQRRIGRPEKRRVTLHVEACERCVVERPLENHEQTAGDHQHNGQSRQKSDTHQLQSCPREPDHREVHRQHDERNPESDELRLTKSEEGHHRGGDQNLRLLPKNFVEQQLPARHRRGKKELNFGLTERQSAAFFRPRPREEQPDEREDRHHVDADSPRAHEHPAQENEPEIREAGDERDQIARLAQPAQPLQDAILERSRCNEPERANHEGRTSAAGGVSLVMRRNASSSETSLRPCAICHFRSSIVPYAMRLPF